MNKEHRDPHDIDLEAPHLLHGTSRKMESTSRHGVLGRLKLAQQKGLKFHQTSCNAIILYDTPPAYCISTVVRLKTEAIMNEKVYASPRPPLKISFHHFWMKVLDSEVAENSEHSQQIQPKSKTQLSRMARLVAQQPPGLLTKEIGKDVLFGFERTNSRTGENL